MSSTAFIAIAESYGLVSRFLPGLDGRDFILSYAREIPDTSHYEKTCYWMSGGYAARMRRIGLASNLTAPGQSWLSTVDESLTGREIVTDTFSAMPSGIPLWAKPAEAKIDSVVAGKYTKDDIALSIKVDNIPSSTLFQWTESIMSINHEHRFFVADGKVMTGSPYLIDGVVYHSTMTSPYYDDAYKAAKRVVKALGDNQPPAYTLDMGRNENTKQWIIVEANPAWSSGPYGCDPREILKTLDVACNSTDSRWAWEPADYLVQRALLFPKMEIVDANTASGVFIRYA